MRHLSRWMAAAWFCFAVVAYGDDYDYFAQVPPPPPPIDEPSVPEPADQAPTQFDPTVRCGCCCDCGNCCCDPLDPCSRLFGVFLPSDHCFDRFISPISNPFFFEDPRSLTEVRGILVENSLPSTIGRGDVQVWATQLRGRLSERLSVIAPRLGYLQVNQTGGSTNGFLTSPVGFKYNLIRDVDRQFLVSAGMTYFIPGENQAASDFNKGDFHFFLSGAKEIFGNGHWVSGTGFRIPSSSTIGTQLWYWSNQWDYELPNHIYPLVGVNWFHWMRSSPLGFPNPAAGLDIINLPVQGIAGKNVATGVVGLKWKPSGHLEVGSGFEFPMTHYTDVIRNRLYVDVIVRY
jgi:hypothetical protein